MKTETIYYIILLVYILLWACELVVCHMTHSLIILTDSYINLYKILEISLGLLHLCTQHELTKHQLMGPKSSHESRKPILAGRLFKCICTYQFKRLPLLGSFMNGLFLAALLMSAAIEGIQTCVHSSHSEIDHDVSILHKDRLTYPIILAALALVGIIMQQCSLKAHEMREEDLQSESLLDINVNQLGLNCQVTEGPAIIRELTANNLNYQERCLSSSSKRRSYDLNLLPRRTSECSSSGTRSPRSSLQELPNSLTGESIPNGQENCISLKSLKFATNLESFVQPVMSPIGTISQDLEAFEQPSGENSRKKDNWFVVRFIASPAAMLFYGAINYYITDDFLTEIFDATLSICVVSLLFAASYPPMIRAGRVLLQTVPDGVDLIKLKKDLMSSSEHVLDVNDLHVWSLTPRSNRVATCQLVLDKNRVCEDKQVDLAICEAKYKFHDQNIKCTTIEPVLKERELKN